jgi:hypothetical protein
VRRLRAGAREGRASLTPSEAPRKRGPGRPPLGKQATAAVLSVRLTAAERAAVEKAASAAGQSASKWARAVVVAASGAVPA